ncbi:hypothetical protein [Brevibacillus massiliensis]|uniref:hypothetical protein n=1 Tax=Brevibacillus massiliensis TaxID=1118054 RepID=UPI000309F500|nr:hypothetical protein [Brevibacillus massiliensis]
MLYLFSAAILVAIMLVCLVLLFQPNLRKPESNWRKWKRKGNEFLEKDKRFSEKMRVMLTILGGGQHPIMDLLTLFVLSIAAGVVSMLTTMSVVHQFSVGFLFGIVGMGMPYLAVVYWYLKVTSNARKKFLFFVQEYLNTYVYHGKVITLAFKRMGDKCPPEFRSILTYLNIRLSDSSPFDEVMWEFADILRLDWATDFVYIVISGQRGDTKDIEKALNGLIVDLYNAKNVDEERRSITRMVSWFILALMICCPYFIVLNMEFLPAAKRIYFQTQAGLNFLALGSLTCFLCYVGSLIWAKKGERL